jgi:uncharacterized repeat protein (TIGR01451 family)
MRVIFLNLLFLLIYFSLNAQNNTPCTALDFNTTGEVKAATPTPSSVAPKVYNTCDGNGLEDNPSWFKFIPKNNNTSITIKVGDCSNLGLDKGITAKIFKQRTPSCSDLVSNATLPCISAIAPNSQLKFNLSAIAQKTYWLQIDGIKADVCSFSILYNPDSIQYQGKLKINLNWDKNTDCIIDNAEKTIPFDEATILLKQAGQVIQVLRPNEKGQVETIATEGNDYEIEVKTTNSLWKTCSIPTFSVQANQVNEITVPIQVNKNCAQIETDFSTFCAKNNSNITYILKYKNLGTETAQNAKALLYLDENQTFISASVASTIEARRIILALGNLEPLKNTSVKIELKNKINLPLNKANIHKVEIIPNPLCDTPSAQWDKSDIQVFGACVGDSIRFAVSNNGNAESSNKEGIIIEDLIAGKFGNIPIKNLNPKDSVAVFSIEATGKTYRFEVPQSLHHPRKSMPSVTIEGCKKGGGTYSVGYANQYPQDDAEPNIDIDLREIEANPTFNDILGFPKGYGNQYFIAPNQDIEYLMRFKNFSIDSVKRLYIVDTLPLGLDISSLRLGASSHPYSLNISDKRILTFVFDNNFYLNNEDSLYVKFILSQEKDLPLGTKLAHQPIFYTDLDDTENGIAANEIFHTVGKNFITVNAIETFIPNIQLRLFPNPATDIAHIYLDNIQATKSLKLEIFDLSARLVHIQQSDIPQFDVPVAALAKGLYFFRISNEQQNIANGKLLKQ